MNLQECIIFNDETHEVTTIARYDMTTPKKFLKRFFLPYRSILLLELFHTKSLLFSFSILYFIPIPILPYPTPYT